MKRSRILNYLPVVLILVTVFALMLSSAIQKSSTVDEQTHLFRGTAYLVEGATHFQDVHPPVGFSLNALPLLTVPDLNLAVDTPAWGEGRWELAADAFLWQDNPNPLQLIFLGRLPTIFITLLLGTLVYRWGKQIGGRGTALGAMVLLLFDPNILAHGQLITNDITLTFLLTMVFYSYWRWACHGRLSAAVGLGVALGLVAATKYSAVTSLPALAFLAFWLARKRRSWQPILILIFSGMIALVILWGFYGFQVRPFPLQPVWSDLEWTLNYLQRPPTAYLFGETRDGGWWYYFPVAFLLKTTLITLALLIAAIFVTARNMARYHEPSGTDWLAFLSLTLMPIVYSIFTIYSPFNIGYRHLLPAIPFVVLFTTTSLCAPSAWMGSFPRRAVAISMGLFIVVSLFSWPNYIPYFNLLAGGEDSKWRWLSDSNIDWGQDLPSLVRWNDQREDTDPLFFSYFGTAHPAAYELNYTPLPTWSPAPEQALPSRQEYDPRDPAPGWYAISVTNLHGHVLGSQNNLYARFRDESPATIINGSIRIYRVEPRGEPIDIAFAGLTPAELDNDLSGLLGGNDRQVRWLNDAEGLVWAAAGSWLATKYKMPDELRSLMPLEPVASIDGQALYWLDRMPSLPWVSQMNSFGKALAFQGSQFIENSATDVVIMTAWEVEETTDRPLKIFIHAIDDTGQIGSQWDGLSVDPISLRIGDRFIQLHRMAKPPGNATSFFVGVYDAETMERLKLPDGRDSIQIEQTDR